MSEDGTSYKLKDYAAEGTFMLPDSAKRGSMITVMGYIHVDPADADEFLPEVKALTPDSKTENGCLFYAIALNCALTGRMLIAERWRDEKPLTAHLETQKTLAFLEKWKNRQRATSLDMTAQMIARGLDTDPAHDGS